MKSGTTNPLKRETIRGLRKTKKGIWLKVAETLEKPSRREINVNLWKISKLTKEGDVIVVPGKVLGNGELEHKVDVAAFAFSKSAKEKLGKSAMAIEDLVKKNPKGIRIIQ